MLQAQTEAGTPFARNYLPGEYGAHTQNFDVAEDRNGNIYVANFAGLLQFDGQDWQLLTTPDISRVLSLGVDQRGVLFLGGLNELGFLEATANGELQYQDLTSFIDSDLDRNFGEVRAIFTGESAVYFFTRNYLFIYRDGVMTTLTLEAGLSSVFKMGDAFLWQADSDEYFLFETATGRNRPFSVIPREFEITAMIYLGDHYLLGTSGNGLFVLREEKLSLFDTPLEAEIRASRISDLQQLSNGNIAIGTELNGVYFIDKMGNEVTQLNRALGLQNDYVTDMFIDSRNRLWLALNNGISLVSYPWPWTQFNIDNGLEAGVVSILRFRGKLYAGTYQGLYVLNGDSKNFELYEGIDFATWDLVIANDQLYAATSEGVYGIDGITASRLTSEFSLSMSQSAKIPEVLFIGTLTGLTSVDLAANQVIEVANDIGQVTDLTTDIGGDIWLTTLTGKVMRYKPQTEELQPMGADQGLTTSSGNRAFNFDGKLVVSTRDGVMEYVSARGGFRPLDIQNNSSGVALWPALIVQGRTDEAWITRGDETAATLFEKQNSLWQPVTLNFSPFQNFVCRAIFTDQDGVTWFGGPSGLIRLEKNGMKGLNTQTSVRLSNITLVNDSTYFGGNAALQAEPPLTNRFNYRYRNIGFSVTSDGYEARNEVTFSHRLVGHEDTWSNWVTGNEIVYNNLNPGVYTLRLRERNAYGIESESSLFTFEILNPWYLKWYVFVVYLLVLALLVWQLVRWRSHKLLKEKEVLESTVQERTVEISSQRDEIQKKSEELSSALTNLEQAQEELIRQEKLASVGQLTKGIVDRVINPLNYINNFSELSMELNQEVKELLDDEMERISEEAFEELEEINGMLSDNLSKIKAHGGNTTRMIKAMEEVLKDRGGVRAVTNLNQLVNQSANLIRHAYKEEMNEHHLELHTHFRSGELTVEASPDELAKSIHQLMDNAIQAVITRCKRQELSEGLVEVITSGEGEYVYVEISDTGVGISDKEVGHIFDPFFTTKTTAKGAGVGLYLVREIILSHKGRIDVSSEVNRGTTFKISLPVT